MCSMRAREACTRTRRRCARCSRTHTAMKLEDMTLGAAASHRWLIDRGLEPPSSHWYVEIRIETDVLDVRFELNIYPEEWGFVFRYGRRVSSIRITDVAFVHGRDEHQLLSKTPPLEQIGELLAELEQRYVVRFAHKSAIVKSNLIRATAAIRPWLQAPRS
jgi:hypothetical protein